MRMMVRKERIPSWRKTGFGFGFELVCEVLELGDEKEGRKGILAAAA